MSLPWFVCAHLCLCGVCVRVHVCVCVCVYEVSGCGGMMGVLM
jgi:hypothetical protein